MMSMLYMLIMTMMFIYNSKWKNNNANVFVENLNDENIHYLVEKLENLDVNNIDVDTVNDVVLNCNSIIKNAADKADMIGHHFTGAINHSNLYPGTNTWV